MVLFLPTMAAAEDRLFWTLTAGAHAAAVYDMETTIRALRRCPSCYEANPVMRPLMDSRSSAYAAGLGLSAVSAYGSFKLKERGSRWWWAPLAGQIGLHVVLGIRNSRLK